MSLARIFRVSNFDARAMFGGTARNLVRFILVSP